MAAISITLKSDLCAGSGESTGLNIDRDVCADRFGIPYIPARRLKGCLRDAARELQKLGFTDVASDEAITALFGDSNGREGSILIENAVLDGQHEMAYYLRYEIEEELKSHTNADAVLSLFTSVRGNTAMENGVAKSGSLRYTRVLNHYSMIEPGKETVLTAHVILKDKNQEQLLCMACKALRHIGSSRNRGFGWIKAEYIPGTEAESTGSYLKDIQTQGRVRIPYKIRLDAPVTLPGCKETLNQIPARSVIGCMAGAYLKQKGHQASDTAFEKLFLSGKVNWSALSPVVQGKFTDPAPLMLCKLSASGKYYNRFSGNREEKLKSIEGMFAARSDKGYILTKPATSEQYHHSKGDAMNDGTLYVQRSLNEGVVYGGMVEADAEDAGMIAQLLQDCSFRFGRSKSAQYAACSFAGLEEIQPVKQDTVQANQIIYVVLNSDLLLSKEGILSAEASDVRSQIAEKLGIKDVRCDGIDDYTSYHMISGYHAQWQLQKFQVTVMRGGSIFAYHAPGVLVPREGRIGCYPQEDMGRFTVYTDEEMAVLNEIIYQKPDYTVTEKIESVLQVPAVSALRSAILYAIAERKIMERARKFVTEHSSDLEKTSKQLRLMAEQCTSYTDLIENRVKHIKNSDADAKNKGAGNNTLHVLEELFGTGSNERNAQQILPPDPDDPVVSMIHKDTVTCKQICDNWKMLLMLVMEYSRRTTKGKGAK